MERTSRLAGSPAAALVFTTLLTQGPLSRVDIVRRTGLSSGAVTKAVRPLIDAGYLLELSEGRAEAVIGRPASPLRVRAERAFFVGVKVTADELIAVVTDMRARVGSSRHVCLPSTRVEDVVAAIGRVTVDLLSESGDVRVRAAHVGVALAGDVDRLSGVVGYSPFLGWRDVALAERVEAATGLTAVIENDVRALTVAEQWFGAGVGTASFALVTVGAGIGCGIFVNGAVVSGAHGVAGEIGHLPIAVDGPPCHCGGRGCVEAVASDPAILEQVAAATGSGRIGMGEAVALARGGHAEARAVFERAGHAIGLALAAVANLVGPERIVISGEGLVAYDLFEGQIRETFAAEAFGAAARCDLVVRPLPFEEWARGAAAAAIRTLVTPGR
jgi:predicted NBD/HSP70 family sugar kinase